MIRLKLKLKTTRGSVLPFNYEEQVSRWIEDQLIDLKRIIDIESVAGNRDRTSMHLATDLCWDHFTFSQVLLTSPFKILGGDGIRLESGEARLTINCYCGESEDQALLAVSILRGSILTIQGHGHSIQLRVVDVVVLNNPVLSPVMRFKTETPIFMSTRIEGSTHPVHVSPTMVLNYDELMKRDLLERAKSAGINMKDATVVFKCLTEPQSKMLRFGNWKYRAFHYEFMLAAPVELMELAYYAGFGMLTRELGLGVCSIVPEEESEAHYSLESSRRVHFISAS